MRVLTSRTAPGVEVEDQRDGVARIPLGDALSMERFHELARPLADDTYARVAACNPDTLAVVEQTPEYVQVWEEGLAIFPDAWFVHVVRDPRSVFCSHRNAAKSWADPTRFSHDPIEVAGEWCQDVTRARAIARATERYLEVRYEDLRREPVEGLGKLFEWLELPADEELCRKAVEACSIDRMRGTQHAPKGFFRKGESEGWRREMSPAELANLEYVAGTLMREAGYEPVTDTSRMPAQLRARLRRQKLKEGLGRWAWQSDGPLKRGASRVLKSFPGLRKILLRNIHRPAG